MRQVGQPVLLRASQRFVCALAPRHRHPSRRMPVGTRERKAERKWRYATHRVDHAQLVRAVIERLNRLHHDSGTQRIRDVTEISSARHHERGLHLCLYRYLVDATRFMAHAPTSSYDWTIQSHERHLP